MKIKIGGILGLLALLSTVVCAEPSTPALDNEEANNEQQQTIPQDSKPQDTMPRDTVRYIGAGVSFFESDDFNLPVFDVRYGQELTDVFAIEARAGLGLSDDEKGRIAVKENYFLGAYGRANYAINNEVTAYAFAGLAFVDYNVSLTNGGEASDSQFDFSGGFGGSYAISEKMSLGLEFWIQDLKDTSGFSLNASYRM